MPLPDRIAARGDADVINSLDIDTDSCPPCPSCPGLPCTQAILRDRRRGWADVQMANSIRPLIQFDLRGLPSAAVLSSTWLNFSVAEFCQETGGTNEGLAEVMDDDNWDEFDPTWNTQPTAAAQIGEFEFATGWICSTGLRTSQEVALDISAGLPWAEDGLLSVILRRLHEDVAEYDADPTAATWSRYYLAAIRAHEEVGIYNPEPYRGPLLQITASVPDEPPPHIVRTDITPSSIQVSFSTPMERRPTEQAIWVEMGTTLAALTYAWSTDGMTVTLTPTVAILPPATLALSIGPTARDRTGRFLLLDADGDGVLDDCDACLNTIPGALVDAVGWPARQNRHK